MAQAVKNPPANAGDAGDMGSIPGLGRYPGGGNGNPLQYSCLGNPLDRGAWRATVYGVVKSQTQLGEMVTGRKARGLQTEEIGCKCQTFFLSLLSSRRKQTSDIFFPLLHTNLKKRFILKYCVAIMTPVST